MNLMSSSYLISIRSCQRHLDRLEITPLHFMSVMLLFGCDFYPGLNNISLTSISESSSILDLTMKLLTMKSYITSYSLEEQLLDRDNRHNLKVNEKRMLRVIEMIYKFQSERLCSSNVIESNTSSNESTENNDDNKTVRFISYSNIDTKSIKVTPIDCHRDCILCRPNRYSSSEDMTVAAREYIRLYMWTVNYFRGILKNNRVSNSSVVFTSFVAPSVKSIIRVLTDEGISYEKFSIDIIHPDTYSNSIEDGLGLEYSILPSCQFIKTYNDDVSIFSKELKNMKVFH